MIKDILDILDLWSTQKITYNRKVISLVLSAYNEHETYYYIIQKIVLK